MQFNNHSELNGFHAFLGASKYHWVNYDEAHLEKTYLNHKAVARGTRLHAFAKEAIELGINLPRTNRTLDKYVNDAIGYRMTPEVVLYYSPNCFGTADSISFKRNKLRIHDLKTGVTKANPTQLYIYAALFCLEYDYKPSEIEMELRIYQSDEIHIFEPSVDEISHIMDKIVHFDKILTELDKEM